MPASHAGLGTTAASQYQGSREQDCSGHEYACHGDPWAEPLTDACSLPEQAPEPGLLTERCRVHHLDVGAGADDQKHHCEKGLEVEECAHGSARGVCSSALLMERKCFTCANASPWQSIHHGHETSRIYVEPRLLVEGCYAWDTVVYAQFIARTLDGSSTVWVLTVQFPPKTISNTAAKASDLAPTRTE